MDASAEISSEAMIPMKDLRDAMDCSLALTSQAIENHIGKDETVENGFYLTVGELDYSHALDTIRRFRDENRRWRWRKPFVHARISFRWSSIIWCLVLGAFAYLPDIKPGVVEGGILNSALVFDGEWWRVMTATMLHRDIAHLFSNLSAGFVLFGLAMGRFGSGIGLLTILLTGVGGNLFGLAYHMDPYRGLGASGAVMGALGMLGPHAIGLVRQNRSALRLVVSGLLGVVMLFVLFGMSPESDVIAHFGGFISGIAFGAILGFVDEEKIKHSRWNLIANVVILFGLLWSWGAALGQF
jgi:rhomboid protease GluP